MFRSAVSTFRSGECTFRSGERTFRNAEYKANTVQRYIKTGYYANIYTTVFIHLPLFNTQRLCSTYCSLTLERANSVIFHFLLSLLSLNILIILFTMS